jgi:hypothetical protein
LTKKVSRILLSVVSLSGLATSQGCSYLFVQPAPPGPPRSASVNSTTNRAAPVIDTIFTATNLASAAYVAGQDDATNKGQAVTLGLAVAGLWLSSAIYGYAKTSECEDVLAEDDQGPYRPANYRMVVPGGQPYNHPSAPPPSYGPPPGYAPPPGYGPPPGYAPPPGYGPPPGYAPPPPSAPPPTPAPPAAAPTAPVAPPAPQNMDTEQP